MAADYFFGHHDHKQLPGMTRSYVYVRPLTEDLIYYLRRISIVERKNFLNVIGRKFPAKHKYEFWFPLTMPKFEKMEKLFSPNKYEVGITDGYNIFV
jgi:hypothetical protein